MSSFPSKVGLTVREAEVLTLYGHGLTCRAIARQLAIAEQTVKEYLSNVRVKLGAASSAEAVRIATEHELFKGAA